jgi:acetylglutamate kinase
MSKRRKPHFLIGAFYESRFRDNLFVIKAGGKIVEDPETLDNLLGNIRDLTLLGIKVFLVYGHGHAVDVRLESRNIKVRKINGRRVTDAPALEAIKEVVGGILSLNVLESMARSKLQGVALSAFPADWMRVAMRSRKPVDYGLVGDIKAVESRPVLQMFKVTNFIASSCLGIMPDGQMCNVNADTVAAQVAIALQAHKLIFLSDVEGVIVNGKTVNMLAPDEISKLIEKGVATGGMKVKLENCLTALQAGVKRIHLVSGLKKNALEREIYEPSGSGTMLIQESDRENYLNEVQAQRIIDRQKKGTK